jgi:hypothetical protein
MDRRQTMKTYNLLHKTLGKPELQIVPPESFFRSPVAKVDEDLVALWREDGWARYAGGLFWTIDPRDFVKLYKDWSIVPQRALVFGRNTFGDLFLLHKGEVRFLSIQGNQLLPLGPSFYLFMNSTLGELDLMESFLDSKLFQAVRKRLGELETDECYGLFPALPLGGDDEDPKSYRRVKLREYLALLAQMHD